MWSTGRADCGSVAAQACDKLRRCIQYRSARNLLGTNLFKTFLARHSIGRIGNELLISQHLQLRSLHMYILSHSYVDV